MTLSIGELASTASSLLWAVALIFFAKAGDSIRPSALNLFKSLLGVPLIWLTAIVLGGPLFAGDGAYTYTMLAVSGILGMTVGDSLIFASLARVGAGWTAVVNATYSPFMILVTAVGFSVPLTGPVLLGTALIVAAILIAHSEASAGERAPMEVLKGLGLGLAGQLAMAISMAMLKYPVAGHASILDSEDALFVTFWRLLFGTVALGSVMAATRRGRAEVRTLKPGPSWRFMVPGALFGTWLALIVWILGMKEIEGSLVRAAILNQSNVIFLPILGAIFLKEQLTLRKGLAIILAFGGATVVVLGG